MTADAGTNQEQNGDGQQAPGSDDGGTELQGLKRQFEEAQKQIGKQSTEIGNLRKQVEEAQKKGTAPPPQAPAKPDDKPEPISVSEKDYLDQRWKSLSEQDRGQLLSGAEGKTRAEKLSSVRNEMLSTFRENMVTVPDSLFDEEDPAAAPSPPQSNDAYRQLLKQAVLGADREKHRMPVRGRSSQSGVSGVATTVPLSRSFNRSDLLADQQRLQRTGGGLPLDLVAKNRGNQP